MAEFRFVLVGSGNMAGTYVNAVNELENAEIVGVVSRSGNRPPGLDASVPVVNDLSAVDVPFDAVIVSTPNGLHHQSATAAAAMGKHVLTEKVLDVTAENMDRMISVCRDAGVKLGVAFQRRMSPDNRAVKDLLDAGACGRIFGADLRVMYYRDQAYYDSAAYRGTCDLDGGGPFMQQAAHNIDIYTWFFGLPVTVVSMLDTFCHDIEGEDHGVAVLRHDDGMIGCISASTAAAPGHAAELSIFAEKGTVILTNDCISHWSIDGVDQPQPPEEFKVHDGAASAAVSDTAGHEAILSDFIAAVEQDRDPAVPGESARLATDLILQIYNSRVQGEPTEDRE